MDRKLAVLYVALWTFAVVSAKNVPPPPEEEKEDLAVSESKFIKSVASLPPIFANPQPVDDSSYPYEGHPIVNSYGVPPVPQASYGVSLNTNAILAPQVEILRLVEAFIRLKGELLNRLYALLNDNWDLIRAVINLVLTKLQNLHAFSLKGISVFRKILEFALNLFADWTVTLPSFTLGAGIGSVVQPQPVYGAPTASATGNFLQGWHH